QTATAKLPGGTVYTGNIVDGKPVVSTLGVTDLEPGKIHRLYFRGVEGPSGQPWLVSVAVLRGAKPGKRVTLVSGVHGDEMSSIHAVQTIINGLDPAVMSGTVMAGFDVSRPAVQSMGRAGRNPGRVQTWSTSTVSGRATRTGRALRRAMPLFCSIGLSVRTQTMSLIFIPALLASMPQRFTWRRWKCQRSGPWRNSSQSTRSSITPVI